MCHAVILYITYEYVECIVAYNINEQKIVPYLLEVYYSKVCVCVRELYFYLKEMEEKLHKGVMLR